MSLKMVAGVHALTEALSQQTVLKLLVARNKQSKNVQLLVEKATAAGIPVERVELYELDMLLPNVRHQGVIGETRAETDQPRDWQAAIAGKKQPLILVLDALQDPHNLGACLRSAVAAGVDAVLIPNARAADITPTVEKVACGAAALVPIFKVSNLRREVEKMKAQGIWIVGGAGEASQSLYDVDLKLPLALIVGNEGDGIRHGLREACDFLAAIPIDPAMESLNVSVACGVMLFEARRQRLLVP